MSNVNFQPSHFDRGHWTFSRPTFEPSLLNEQQAYRAGFVALAGTPNVGKSTLFNALVGQQLSIVSRLPQTTREQVTGILTTERYQIAFLDTPGLLEPQYALQEAMRWAADRAIHDADLTVFVADATRRDSLPDPALLGATAKRSRPVLVAINKSDIAEGGAVSRLEERAGELGYESLVISALVGKGLGELSEWLVTRLPESPPFFPPEQSAVQSVRFFVEELVRETFMEQFREEIPYSITVRVDEFREESDPVYIRATIYVERESQKGIVIGRAGRAVKKLGEDARRKIEELIAQRVYLELRVKVMARWSRKRGHLKQLGFRLPRPRNSGQDGP